MRTVVNTPAGSGSTAAVFFDVDFTLIYPGPTFQGAGYVEFCGRHGLEVDAARFPAAVMAASPILDDVHQVRYDEELFVRYTRTIIEGMGGTGAAADGCAREVYAEWAACRHFSLYDDVKPALQALSAAGIKVGLISNSHRCLDSFQSHFELDGLIEGAVSSSEHGFLKPHPSIFEAALDMVGVRADQAVMVGDSLRHDIKGARGVGMGGVLIRRTDGANAFGRRRGTAVIESLSELPALL